MMVWLIGYGV